MLLIHAIIFKIILSGCLLQLTGSDWIQCVFEKAKGCCRYDVVECLVLDSFESFYTKIGMRVNSRERLG